MCKYKYINLHISLCIWLEEASWGSCKRSKRHASSYTHEVEVNNVWQVVVTDKATCLS